MARCYLYIYRNDDLHQVYVGIGDSTNRIWQGHSKTVDTLRNHAATEVFVTTEPFKDRETAEKAESIAICAAAAAGKKVFSDLPLGEHRALRNVAKVSSSRHLDHPVFTQPGTVALTNLKKTAIVTLTLDQIDERGTIHGGRSDETICDRARRWWGLGEAENRRRAQGGRTVDTLLAIQKGTFTILGAWTLTDEQWQRSKPSWEFLIDSPIPEIDEWKGKTFDWCGKHPSNAVTWSRDIEPPKKRRLTTSQLSRSR